MKATRSNIFETNSSSSHSITFVPTEQNGTKYDQFLQYLKAGCPTIEVSFKIFYKKYCTVKYTEFNTPEAKINFLYTWLIDIYFYEETITEFEELFSILKKSILIAGIEKSPIVLLDLSFSRSTYNSDTPRYSPFSCSDEVDRFFRDSSVDEISQFIWSSNCKFSTGMHGY